jgi:hypothetical protein
MICKCTPLDGSYDNRDCPTHGPDAPRYFVDHGTIHDRVTGKHVETEKATALLNAIADLNVMTLKRHGGTGTMLHLAALLDGRDYVPKYYVQCAKDDHCACGDGHEGACIPW